MLAYLAVESAQPHSREALLGLLWPDLPEADARNNLRVTWSQLRLHRKRTGLLNVGGYYDPLVRLVDHAVQEGFIKVKHRELLLVEERSDVLLHRLANEPVIDEPKL